MGDQFVTTARCASMFIAAIFLAVLAGVQARYIGLRDYGDYDSYYYQPLNYGPSNPFGSSSAGLSLNPHYAYSRAAYQDYKYQQVKYTPYRQAPYFNFGHEEDREKHYCPASRPFYIRATSRCVDRCVVRTGRGKSRVRLNTDYNPYLEACCAGPNQRFNMDTLECETCTSVTTVFDPSTRTCIAESK